MLRRLVTGVAFVVMATGSVLSGIAAAGPQNTVVVEPSEGPPGTSVTVQHSPGETCGVAPNPGEAVEVRIVGLDGVVLTSARTDVAGDGAWQVAEGLVVPDAAAAGDYAVLATCNPDGEGFAYSPSTLTVTEPPAVTTTTATTTTTTTTVADAGDTTPVEAPATRAGPPAADIGGLVVAGVVLFVATIGVGWWLWRQIVTSATTSVRLQRMVGWLAVVGAVVFTASWIVSGLLQDAYSERVEYISALGAPGAKYAWIMVLGFLAAGVSVVLLAIAGHAGLRNCGVRALGPTVALGLVGASLFDLGVLRSDCSRVFGSCARASTSWHHDWHTVLGSIAVLGVVVSAFWFARLFAATGPLRHLSRRSTVLAAFTLLGPLFLADPIRDNGLTQRAFLLSAALVVAHLGGQLVRLARPPAS